MSAPPQTPGEIIAICRRAFGKSMLQVLNDEQTLEFFRVIKQQYTCRSPTPFETVCRLVLAWKVVQDPNARTLMHAVRRVGIKLFGKFNKVGRAPKPLIRQIYPRKDQDNMPEVQQVTIRPQKQITASRPATKSNADGPPDTAIESDIKSKFDPLAETIDLVRKLKGEFDYWSQTARANGMADQYTQKIAHTLRDVLKDGRELLRDLGLLNEDTLAEMQRRVHIDTVNVMIQQNIENPSNLNIFMTELIGSIGDISGEQTEESVIEQALLEPNETDETEYPTSSTATADGEHREGSADSLQACEEERSFGFGDQDS